MRFIQIIRNIFQQSRTLHRGGRAPKEANMEDYLQEKLQTKLLKKFNSTYGGCISSGCCFQTDNGKIFVKYNSKSGADIMFNGEFHGLKEIYSTKTIKVPEPILTGEIGNKKFIVMEYLNIKATHRQSSPLGKSLADLHLHNIKRESNNIDKFGFHLTTCCGYLPQNNEWCEDWVQFYASQRLLPQIQMIEKNKNCREVSELWSQLQIKIPSFFKGLNIKPSLLHGDLWSGNAGETNEDPVIYDPAAFYGHHEYDLAIANMFGGFDNEFYKAYHNLIPKEEGFEKRHELYKLFHHLNHWNHFGSAYRDSSLQIMRNLIK